MDVLEEMGRLTATDCNEDDGGLSRPEAEWRPEYEVGDLYHVDDEKGPITEDKIMGSPLFVFEGAVQGYHTKIHKFRSVKGDYLVSCSDIQAVERVRPAAPHERGSSRQYRKKKRQGKWAK